MRSMIFALLAVCFLGFAGLGCANWRAMSPNQQVVICQEAFRVALRPECTRLIEKGQKYADLCTEVVDDVIEGCEAIITRDASVMCKRITKKAEMCALISDDSDHRDQNVATCERVIRIVGLACEVSLTRPEEVPVDPERPR